MKFKYLGKLDSKVAEKWNLSEHKNKPILVYEDRIEHAIDHHLSDFGSEEKINKTYLGLRDIINKPDYVFYNFQNNGLEYYKKQQRIYV